VVPVAGTYGDTIHQLAARKVLQELEDGVGYLHRGRNAREEWVKNEGVRVGLRYGVASKWTSFLAVQREEEEEVVVRREDVVGPSQSQDIDQSSQGQTELGDDDTYDLLEDDDVTLGGGGGNMDAAGGYATSVPTMMAFIPPAPAIDYPTKSKLGSPRLGKVASAKRPGKGGGKMASSGLSSYSKLFASSPPSPKCSPSPPFWAYGEDAKSLTVTTMSKGADGKNSDSSQPPPPPQGGDKMGFTTPALLKTGDDKKSHSAPFFSLGSPASDIPADPDKNPGVSSGRPFSEAFSRFSALKHVGGSKSNWLADNKLSSFSKVRCDSSLDLPFLFQFSVPISASTV
jgi:hypothetical protein